MTIIVGFIEGGVIIAEATPAAAGIVGTAINEFIATGAVSANTGNDAYELGQSIQSSINLDPNAAATILTANLIGGAVTMALLENGLAAGVIGASAFAAGILLSPEIIATAAVVGAIAAGYYASEYATYLFQKMQQNNEIRNPDGSSFKLPPLPLGDADGDGIPDIHQGHWINVKTSFDNLANSPQRSDPFTLDLNGNGIDTVGISTTNPILFDIDADGVKTSTGWIAATDGLLVLDRNGNGTIDNGRELFGDATLKSNGQLAADGFDAIADQDTNHDGIISSLDTNWNNLRVWRDLNQDGISQSNELVTLNSLGIASINVTKQEHNSLLNNGNVLADLGTFTYTSGTSGTAGTAANLADVNLAQDTFTSQFTDHITLTTQAATLPDLQGSGQVRNLQEAVRMDYAINNNEWRIAA